MTAVVSFDREDEAPLESGPPGAVPERPDPPSRRGFPWCWLPAVISVGVNCVFAVAWWLPEFSRFPRHEAVLTQLWPLATKELVSAGQPVVDAQLGRSGLLAALLLVASLALPFLIRSPRWPVRVIGSGFVVYAGVVAWVVTALSLLARDAWAVSLIGLLLITGWVVAAGATAWRTLWTPVEALPPRPTNPLWVVGLFALLYPVPLAIGRSLFAAELTPAARDLLDTDPTLRIAALNDFSTVACYLSGLFLALVVWAGYMLVPPQRPVQVPWVRSRASSVDPLVARLVILVLCLVGLAGAAISAAETGPQRAEQLRSGSPAGDILDCAAWAAAQPGRPTASLIARGYQCRQVSAYVGYDQTGQLELANSPAPMRASLPDGRRISTRVVSGQYGTTVVLATSSRLDTQPDELVAVAFGTAAQQWSFRCDDDGPLSVRFAAADGAEDAAAGHLTLRAEKPSVVIGCTNQAVRLDPRTGQPLG